MSMPLDDHIRCRAKVCVVCYRKSSRIVSKRDIKTIQTYLIDGYTKDNINFPSGLCNGCHLLLVKKSVDENTVLPLLYSYDPERPTLLHSDLLCPCKICKVAKSTQNTLLSKKKKAGHPRSSSPPTGIKNVVVCSKCFSKIGRGYSHNCSRRGKVSSVQDLLVKSPTTSQKVASRIIKDSATPLLATLGPSPKSVQPAPGTIQKRLFTLDDMSLIQKDLNFR